MSKYDELLKRVHELRHKEDLLLNELDDLLSGEEVMDNEPTRIRIGIVSKHLPGVNGVFVYDIDPSMHLYPQVLDATKRAQTEPAEHVFRADPADLICGVVQRDDIGDVV